MNWVELANVAAAVAVSTALNSLWLSLLLAVLAWGVVRLLPAANAATRYAIWFTALVLAVATPAMLWIPKTAAPAPAAILPAAPAHWAVPVTAQWPVYAALAWLAGTLLLAARIACSISHIRGLKRRALLIGRRGNVRVLVSADARVPMAAGFLHRAIVFPQSLHDQLTAAEFEQVLCHEMAHLRRGDDWTQLAQAVVEALFFFNPAIHWIGRRLKIEREMACDDWVVSATGEARPYAACLTRLHELARRAPAPQLAPGAIGRKKWQISARIEALLQPGHNSTARFSHSGWMAAGALVSAALLVAAKATPLVGVQELPVAQMAMAELRAPTAPAISAVSLEPRRVAPARARLVARAIPKTALQPSPGQIDAPIVLVREWQVGLAPGYFVIAVVYFEPPPPTVMHGI